ncbi:MAG: FUSC family protein [Marinicaulis sp.]|nr:FUSC family protein [Marinicaulis sp.]
MARLALQSAIAACIVFIVMQAAGMPEKFVGILSAVLIVQPSIGSTLGEALERLLAAFVGSVIGIICLLLLPDGYGTASALAFSMLIINAIAAIKPQWRYGVVAAVALSLGAEANATETAIDRGLAIGIGIAVGIFVSICVWPETAERRAKHRLDSALNAAADRMEIVVRSALGDKRRDSGKEKERFHENMKKAASAIGAIRLADTKILEERMQLIEQLYNSVLILNCVDKESDDVLSYDKDFRCKADELCRNCSELARGLVDGERGHQRSLNDVDVLLSSIKGALSNYEKDKDQGMRTATLVFGLSQAFKNLRNLVENYGDK